MSLPLISIVTPSFNRADMIGDAVESVLAQNDPAFEHIIVDGGSTDGTLAVLKQYPHLRVICEPDEGIYDALNKGLRLARGEISGWLNTDDLFAEGAFRAVREVFSENPSAQAVAGGADMFTGKIGDKYLLAEFSAFGDGQDFWRRIVTTPVTNAWFIKTAVFQTHGFYNQAYRYVADRDFFIATALKGVRASPLYRTLYHYRQHSGSATFSQETRAPARVEHLSKVFAEDLQMLEAYLDQPHLPRAARLALRQAHGQRAAQFVLLALYHRRYLQAGQLAGRGCKYEVTWPLVFIRRAVGRLVKEFQHGNR